jgi:hypothetical protein
MALDFPTSPSPGQIFTGASNTWTWNGTGWMPSGGAGAGGASVTIAPTAPGSPSVGNLWWDSTGGQLYIYYDDSTSQQWVITVNAGFTGASITGTPVAGQWAQWTDATHIQGATLTIAANTIALPRGYIDGLVTSRNSVTPNTKIDVAVGVCRNDTDAFNIVFSATKTIDCGIVGANGLDAGSLVANTWYHAFAIAMADGTAAALASTSLTAPTMPSGYVYKRRIGSVKTDVNTFIQPFKQMGDYFEWNTNPPPNDFATGALASANRTAIALSVPPGVIVTAYCSFHGADTIANGIYFTTHDQLDNGCTPNQGLNHLFWSAAGSSQGGNIRIRTNVSRQIYARAFTGAACQLYLTTYGWVDPRGRDA